MFSYTSVWSILCDFTQEELSPSLAIYNGSIDFQLASVNGWRTCCQNRRLLKLSNYLNQVDSTEMKL